MIFGFLYINKTQNIIQVTETTSSETTESSSTEISHTEISHTENTPTETPQPTSNDITVHVTGEVVNQEFTHYQKIVELKMQ